jgi:hypothetical protein
MKTQEQANIYIHYGVPEKEERKKFVKIKNC